MSSSPPRTLLSLSIGGIQDFVYDVEAEGAAKRLRLRSAVLLLIPSVIAAKIRERDPRATILYNGASQLLLETDEGTFGQVANEISQLREWLLSTSGGRLNLYWAKTPRKNNLSEDIRQSQKDLARAKWSALRDQANWHPFLSEINAPETESCPGDKEWEKREGGKLLKEQWKGFRFCEKINGAWVLGPWHLLPTQETPCDVYLLTSPQETQLQAAIPLYAPLDSDGDITELEKLAKEGEKEGKGAPYLAVLKWDGDGVGAKLREALDKDPNAQSYQTLSKKLSGFFGNKLLQTLKDKFPRIYLVYSGGDDLVLVGHFWNVLQSAQCLREELQKEFRAEGITASAGISAFHKKAPIISAIRQADTYLEKAKEGGKNRVCAFGMTLPWDEFQQALQYAEELVQGIKNDQIPRGALQLIKVLGTQYQEALSLPKIKFPPEAVFPRFHYFAERRKLLQNSETSLNYLQKLQEGDDATWRSSALVATLSHWKTKSTEEER
ncbi:MAG: hypothetical protein K6T17_08010, partial [Fimbriimonadales bacterium]|nr:hypothetical protein [Fimbriimonadales bacterium]